MKVIFLSNSCTVTEINWTLDLSKYVDDINNFKCTAKFRYRQPDSEVELKHIKDNDYHITFKTPLKAVTPGQEAVFYLNDICLGGGVIDKVSQ